MIKEISSSTKIGRCEVKIAGEEEGYEYSSHVIEFDERNKICIETRDALFIRVSDVILSNEEACLAILGVIQLIARISGYKSVYFAGKMTGRNVDWFRKAGFLQSFDITNPYDVFLDYEIKNTETKENNE